MFEHRSCDLRSGTVFRCAYLWTPLTAVTVPLEKQLRHLVQRICCRSARPASERWRWRFAVPSNTVTIGQYTDATMDELTKSLVLWPHINRRDWIAARLSFLISAIDGELQDVNLGFACPV
jgi:dolichyl-phosphate-mannose--protein O-mannosyl transferase